MFIAFGRRTSHLLIGAVLGVILLSSPILVSSTYADCSGASGTVCPG